MRNIQTSAFRFCKFAFEANMPDWYVAFYLFAPNRINDMSDAAILELAAFREETDLSTISKPYTMPLTTAQSYIMAVRLAPTINEDTFRAAVDTLGSYDMALMSALLGLR